MIFQDEWVVLPAVLEAAEASCDSVHKAQLVKSTEYRSLSPHWWAWTCSPSWRICASSANWTTTTRPRRARCARRGPKASISTAPSASACSDSEDTNELVDDLSGLSGFELESMVDLASIECVKAGKEAVSHAHLVEVISLGRAETRLPPTTRADTPVNKVWYHSSMPIRLLF